MTGSAGSSPKPDTEPAKGGSAHILCRDCGTRAEAMADRQRCPTCKSPRLIAHNELFQLGVAHIDCDAFYAAIEKRDNPDLHDKPLIIGGGRRGVVSTCCYIARIKGVHSAMPMFQAKKLCPEAIILRPDMEKYQKIGYQIRDLMREYTPLVEPLSIDEAFLDLRGTDRLHGGAPAQSLVQLVNRIEKDIGITVSVGLSHNKFLAKLASDLDKPRGFSIIGAAETLTFLADLPVNAIYGIGKAMQKKFSRDGIRTIGQLQKMDERDLVARYDSIGLRLARLSRGQDSRKIVPQSVAKSISSETTFSEDLGTLSALEKHLWALSERTADRCKRKNMAGTTIVLKLKTSNFTTLTRNRAIADPTQLADTIFAVGKALLTQLLTDKPGTKFRLIGIGVSGLVDGTHADPPDLADPDKTRRKAAEQAMDDLRDKFGRGAIKKGRSL
ncbi:MAG: DNA polymerase IV [Parvibaculales bacterium]